MKRKIYDEHFDAKKLNPEELKNICGGFYFNGTLDVNFYEAYILKKNGYNVTFSYTTWKFTFKDAEGNDANLFDVMRLLDAHGLKYKGSCRPT